VSRWLVDRASSFLATRTSRRSFLARSAVVGSALAVAPMRYVLRPGSAYQAVCACVGSNCACGAPCCDGYTEFCCTFTGVNDCPPGTFAGGWWKADGSVYCQGTRYYIDCMGECVHCTNGCAGTEGGNCAGQNPFCDPPCANQSCGCALGNCNYRRAGCNRFRYGQCHQEIACTGAIACRVVTCDPAYLFMHACGSTSCTDQATVNHNASCLQAGPPGIPPELIAYLEGLEEDQMARYVFYGNQHHLFWVDPDGSVGHRWLVDGVWRRENGNVPLARGADPVRPAITSWILGPQLHLNVDAQGAGTLHIWYQPGLGWASEVLTR
jgi:hypothetical protein